MDAIMASAERALIVPELKELKVNGVVTVLATATIDDIPNRTAVTPQCGAVEDFSSARERRPTAKTRTEQ